MIKPIPNRRGRFFAMDNLTVATFAASIPDIMSGIKTGSDGMRVQFDIPEADMGQAVKLIAMRGKRLKITVEVMPEAESKKWGR